METWERANPVAVMWGSHLIKHGSAVRSTTASGESECEAWLGSSAHALGIKAMLNDWHYGGKCGIHMLFATAARQEACVLGKDWGKLDMLTFTSCGQVRKDV